MTHHDDFHQRVRSLVQRVRARAARILADQQSERTEDRMVPSPTVEEELTRAIGVLEELLRRRGVTALVPFLVLWRENIRERVDRLRCRSTFQETAAWCTGVPIAANAFLVAVSAIAVIGTLAMAGGSPVQSSRTTVASVHAQTTVLSLTNTSESAAPSALPEADDQRSEARAVRAHFSSSAFATPPAPAGAAASTDVERQIRINHDYGASVGLIGHSFSHKGFTYFSCTKSAVREAACDAYDIAAEATGASDKS